MSLFKNKDDKEVRKPFEWGYAIIVGIIALVIIYKCLVIIMASFE